MNKNENPLVSITFNIALPVVILNYSSRLFPDVNPIITLCVALSFPVVYGLTDYFKNNKHKNVLSILGTINILLTGGFALFTLEGVWFAVKEAAIPLLIGCWVLFSGFTDKPLMKWVVDKSSIFQTSDIAFRLDSQLKRQSYKALLKRATLYLSYCFFFSAVLNFIVGIKIFAQKSVLSDIEKQNLLNEQIADMTWISFLVIGLPLTVISGWTLWWFINRLRKLTGLSLEQIIFTGEKASSNGKSVH
ncbi:MAG: hypothetical protein OXK80_01485 [Bdellovibrionales bacterium]|nr:hypothetical protein [Bdellovibrionales bacterium]